MADLISRADAEAWCRRYYARIDAAMDEMMRLVGGESEQPAPIRVIDLFAKHGIGLAECEPAKDQDNG